MMDEQSQTDANQSSTASDGEDATLAKLKVECDEYLAGWKRAQADYQNLKKEVEREKADYTKFANVRLLEEILPVIDQFHLACRYTPKVEDLPVEQRKVWENWLIGLQAVQSLWEQAATFLGLERISIKGSFDPLLHEAVGEEAVEGQTPNTIIKVMQEGWKLHGKVLRPAKVIIAK